MVRESWFWPLAKLALSVSLRRAAGRSCPATIPNEAAQPHAVSSSPRALGRDRALGCASLPSGSESSALARRIALALPPAPRGPGQRHLPSRPPSAGPCAGGGEQRVDGGGGSDERRRRRVLRVAPERPADAALAPVAHALLLLQRVELRGAALRPCAGSTARLRCRAGPRKHCFCWYGVGSAVGAPWEGGVRI